jgi:hypothetical protein
MTPPAYAPPPAAHRSSYVWVGHDQEIWDRIAGFMSEIASHSTADARSTIAGQ